MVCLQNLVGFVRDVLYHMIMKRMLYLSTIHIRRNNRDSKNQMAY